MEIIHDGRDSRGPKSGDDSPSAWLFDVICNLVRHAVPESLIEAICTDPQWGICKECVLHKKRGSEYVRKQINKARGKTVKGEHAFKPADPPASAVDSPSTTTQADQQA